MRAMDPAPSPSLRCDIAIVGGGLAGGLLALALRARQPDRSLLLIEAGDRLGGNHLWSFFDGDLSADARALLTPLVSHRWESGHEVRFPAHRRVLDDAYNSIRSEDFDRAVRAALGKDAVLTGARVATIADNMISLCDKRTIAADIIFDARGFFSPADATNAEYARSVECDLAWPSPTGGRDAPDPAVQAAGFFFADPLATLDCGWQKFVGQTLRLAAPHGLTRPIIMDATVEQIDGYRFVYVLPVGEREIFIEDTYYSNGPELDAATLRARIAAYALAQGWRIEAVAHEEQGVLPVVMGGAFDSFWPTDDPLPRAGVRAGLFHPTTGYSLPDAARFALEMASQPAMDQTALARAARAFARERWARGGYFRLLDTMLFRAAEPVLRYRIFERFYRLPAPLISRFYAGQSTGTDKARILCGKPPVPITRAIHALWSR